MRAPLVNSQLKLTGKGVRVAIIDTGACDSAEQYNNIALLQTIITPYLQDLMQLASLAHARNQIEQ